MTLSLVGYVFGNATDNNPFNVTLPGGCAAGDLAVVAMCAFNADTATPSGFTLLDGPLGEGGGIVEARTAWKVLTSTDISNNFLTMPGTPSFNDDNVGIWICHSTNGTPTVDGHALRAVFDNTSPTVYDSGTITTTGTNDLVLVALQGRSGTGTAWSSTPGGVTIDQQRVGASVIHAFNYHYTFAGPGTTSNQTASLDAANDRETGAVIGVADAVAVSPPTTPQAIPVEIILAQYGIDPWLEPPKPLRDSALDPQPVPGQIPVEIILAQYGIDPWLTPVPSPAVLGTVTGSAAITLNAFISAASGSTVTGTSAQTLDAFVSAATGGFGPSGSAAITLGAFVSAASGSTVVGSAAITLAAFVSAATGGFGPSGSAAITLGAFVSAASGGFGPSGTAAITLGAFVSAASGSTVVGSAAITLDAFVSAATGTFGDGVFGTAAITLDPFTSAASGTVGGVEVPAAVVSTGGSYPTTSLHRHLATFWALDSFASETIVTVTGHDRRADEEALAVLGAI